MKNQRQQIFLIGSLVGISDKFIDKQYVGDLMEVLRMTMVGQALFEEGVEKGYSEGELIGITKGKIQNSREVIKEYLNAKYGFSSFNLHEKVSDIYNLKILDRVIKQLFITDTLEKAQSLIEEALLAQKKLSEADMGG